MTFQKITALILLVTFGISQPVSAADLQDISLSSPQAVKEIKPENAPLPQDTAVQASANLSSTDFLQNTLTLSTSSLKDQKEDQKENSQETSQTNEGYDYERYEFADAFDQLRPEYASAVIVKELKEEDLKKLAALEFETAVLVLHGETVLVTSGSEDEIGVLPAVKGLTGKAAFISHIHPGIHSSEGPSGQDLNEAVEAPFEEYVITHQGVYAYNREGILNDGEPYSYTWYLEKLKEAKQREEEQDQVQARADLNLFIAEQDRYNRATEEERLILRSGGTLAFTAGLTAANVTSLAGSPLPYITAGSTSATTLAVSSNQFSLGYSVPAAGNLSGFTVSFDNATTAGIETQSISALTYLTFGLRGPNASAKLEIVDINNNKDTWTLTGILNTAENFWRLPVASIANTLDKTKIKQLNFVVDQSTTTSTSRTGTFLVRTSGLNVNAPAQPAVTTTIPPAVKQNTFTISGTKDANTSLLINGVEVIARNSATTWSASVNLGTEGNNVFSITAKNTIGKISTVKSVTLVRDTAPPTGTITISSGAVYTASQTVSLSFTTADGTGSGVATMSFSTDNLNWTAAETYAASKSFTLPAGDGLKTVYVKFYDKAGNVSQTYSKSITLDTLPPAGTVKVNGGVTAINQTAVTLNLAATDAGSGLDKMSFSTNGTTWSTAETYAQTKPWTFTSGDGNKTVYVRFTDKSGKTSQTISVTVLMDTVKPTGSIDINSGAVFSNSQTVTLNLSAGDNTGGSGVNTMSFSTDNVNWTSPPETFTNPRSIGLPAGDGNKTVYVKYYDKAGNVSAVYSKSIVLDTTPPTGWALINGGALYTNSSQVSVTLSAQDNGSQLDQVRYSLDNGQTWSAWQNYFTSKTLTLPSGDGNKQIIFHVRDKAANVQVITAAIGLDTTPIVGSIKINGDAAATNQTQVTLNLTADDSFSGRGQMRFTTDTVNWTWTEWENYQSTKTLSLPSGDGLKQVFWQIYDRAWNLTSGFDSILLDTSAPTGWLMINGGSFYTGSRDVTVALSASDSGAGIDKIRFSVDGGNVWNAWENYTESKSFTLPAGEGTKSVRCEVRDLAGNISTVMGSIILDTTAPAASISVNGGADATNNRDVTLTLTALDNLSGLGQMRFTTDTVNWTWTPWEDFKTSKTLMLPAGDGTKQVYWQLYDKAWNLVSSFDGIVLDTVPPAGSMVINGGAVQTSSRDLSLVLTGTDSNSGVDQMRFSVDAGTTWTSWETFGTAKILSLTGTPGDKTVQYQLKDKAGNLSAVYSKIITFTAPAPLQFTSSAASASADYLLKFTADGIAYQENWHLAPGDNDLLVRVPSGGGWVYAKYKVTLNQTLPSFPAMPALPAKPSDLVSVTAETGHVLKYSQGVLWSVEKPGEYELFLPELDSGGNLTGGVLKYVSGDQVLLKNSQPFYGLSSLGEKTLYDSSGNVQVFQPADGKTTRFAYRMDSTGKAISVLSLETAVSSLYENGIPAWILMADGTDIRYADGFLKDYKDAAGNLFSYVTQSTFTNSSLTGYFSQLTSVTPAGAASPVPLGNILNALSSYPSIKQTLENKISLTMEYDAQKQMKKVTSGKNEILELQNSLPVSLKDSTGKVTAVHVDTTPSGEINALSFSQPSLGQAYDEAGKLTTITLSDGTELGVQDQQLTSITLSDGSVLTGLKWNGSLLSDFTRTRADGSKEVYQAQNLIRKEDPNGTVTTYLHFGGADHPDLMKMADGRTYHFIEYQNAQGLTERISELVSMDLEDGSRMEFEQGKPVRYIQKKQVLRDPSQIPELPAGQFYIPSVVLVNGELRGLTIDANATILSGEILFHDGTQYFLQNGELYKQITPDGKIIELSNQDPLPAQLFGSVPPQPLNAQETAYKNQLINSQLDFFLNGAGIDPVTGFPLDNYDGSTGVRSTYSQATLVGMWAEILAAIARGHFVTPKMTSVQAYQKLEKLLLNLIDVQQQAGWNGMFSFFGIQQQQQPVLDAQGKPTGQTQTVTVYNRQFSDIGLGDNLNLSVSLASVIGAIGAGNDPATNAMRDNIMAYAYHIMWKQSTGYDKYYDPNLKRFRMAYQFNADGTGQFTGTMDRVFNEFRTGLMWLAAQSPVYQAAIQNLDAAVRPYETSGGEHIDNAVPYDGGAFQMFWPLIHVDETKYPEFDTALRNFLYSQADYVQAQGIPGLLSAGSDPGYGYNGKMGLPGASETDDALQAKVGSLYGTASAFLLAPHYTLQFLKNLQNAFPGILTAAGYTDSMVFQDVTQTNPVTGQTTVTRQAVFSNQYFGVDQASFILSLMGTSRSYFNNYLDWQGIHGSFDNLYSSMIFGLAPAAAGNPAPPDFSAAATPRLFTGTNPDGLSHDLVKRAAFVSALTDPELGEGKIFDYLTANGQFHHTEIEFTDRTMGLQEYILLPGRGDSARSLTEGLRFDLLNESTKGQGAFFTPNQGYANSSIIADPDLGDVRRLEFDFQAVNRPVGLWAKYENLDLTRYDYFSLPIKLSADIPAGVRLKIELKGMGEIYLSPNATTDWQFLQIPITKPAGLLTEIDLSVQSATGAPVKGEILTGPFSAFKVRVSNNMDWLITLGKTDAELRTLLKQAALQQPSLGGGMVEAEEILENFTLDHDGKLVNGILHLAGGGTQYYQNGVLNKWVFSNGRTVLFEKGLASFVLDLARGKLEEGRFYYDQAFNGQIRSFVLQENDRKRVYGGDGKLQTMVENGVITQFKNGVMDSVTLPDAVLTQLLFADDGNLLKAHVKLASGSEFDIDQTSAQQMVARANGTKIYYEGERIAAIETAQNGRSDFEYSFNTVGQLLGVTVHFNETLPGAAPVSRSVSLAEYLKRPERSVEASEILEGAPYQILPSAGIGGFSIGSIGSGEMTYALTDEALNTNNSYYFLRYLAEGLRPGEQMGYLFKYDNTTGPLIGAYITHPSNPVTLSNYGFVSITLRQNPDMNWNQDFTLRLKTPQKSTLYAFQLPNATDTAQTFGFALDGKTGLEGEMTLEVAREAGGVGKYGRIYVQDISYFSMKTIDHPLWEDQLSMTAEEFRDLKIDSEMLVSVGAAVGSKKPLLYQNLAAYLDLPSWVVYSDKSASETGKLTSFKRFDGSQVFVDGNQAVTKVILPDGTVNEYTAAGVNSAQNVIQGPADAGSGNEIQTADYRYGAIRSVTQADGRKFHFSYEFDASGAEITVMKDDASGEERRFKNGQLIQSSSGALQTKYSYTDGDLAAADMMYKNRVLESTSYHYTQDETLITDEQGTVWYYDVHGNLVKHLTKDGYLYSYSDYSFEPSQGLNLPLSDYKSSIFSATDLRSVTLAGYEAADGSQLILDSSQGDVIGELKFMNGDHGVNLELDGERKIKKGQIQFKDGLIIEIENYIPVRGRLSDGSAFSLAVPAGETYELLQDSIGAYLGIRVKAGDKLYTYDANGRLIKSENASGTVDTFTYTLNAAGIPTAYQQTHAVQLAFNGVPFPKQVDLQSGSTQKVIDSGTEVISHEGNGFVISVFKEDINQWDSLSGSFTSAADRFTLQHYLQEIKPGQAVAMAVSDTAFSAAGETILALLEGLGAGQVRSAAAANQNWSFFGNDSLSKGQASEKAGGTSFSTLTKTVTSAAIPANFSPVFDNQPLVTGMTAAVSTAYNRFLQNYETIKPSADSFMVTVYDKDENVVFTKRIDGTYAYYEKGKIRETFDSKGELLSVHEYLCSGECKTGDDMALSRITLVKARADFEKQSSDLEQQIEQTKYDALYRLAWQDEAARQRIQEEVASGLAAIESQISYLQSIRYQDVKQCKRGFLGIGKSCQHFTVEVPGVAGMINDLYGQRADLLRTKEEQLALVPGQVAAKKTEIETATSERLAELDAKRKEILNDILNEEVKPILTDYFRRILGRDPSTAEIADWVSRSSAAQKLNIADLTSALMQLPERALRISQKSTMITNVKNFLEQYLAAAPAVKTQMLAGLGLTDAETMNLERADLDGVYHYLETRDLHFGQSAFGSLQAMLKAKGVNIAYETLGTEALLIDILTGVINRFTDSELLISVFALYRTAKIHGQTFNGVKYSYDDLKAAYDAACPPSQTVCSVRMIAHVTGDHFVLVERVTADGVTFVEVNQGASGEEKTLSRDNFLKVWNIDNGQGYLLADKPQVIEAKRISDAQAQKVRGSFFIIDDIIFWAFVISAVLSVASIAVSYISPTLGKILGYAAMVAGIVGIVASVGAVVVNGLKAAYTAISAQGVFGAVKTGLQAVGNFLVQSVHDIGHFLKTGFNFIKDGFSGGLSKLGSGITKVFDFVKAPGNIVIGTGAKEYSFSQIASKFLVATGVNYTVSKGLEGMGLNSTVLNLTTAFISAGVIGAGGSLSSFLKSGVQGLIMQGVSEMGLKLNLPPPVTSALSLVTGAALNSWFNINDLTLKQNLAQIAPQAAKQLTLGGAELLGRSFGWDPRLSVLIGLPVAATVGGITTAYLKDNSLGNIFNEIKSSVFSSKTLGGMVSIGASFLGNALNINPLFISLGLRGLAGGIEGLTDTTQDAGAITRFFSGIGGGLKDSLKNIVTLGGENTTPYEKEIYLTQLTSLPAKKGAGDLFDVFENYAGQILGQDTIESIFSSGRNVSDYFKAKRQAHDYQNKTLDDGTKVHEYSVGNNKFVLDENETQILARKFGNYSESGEYGLDAQGRYILKNGTMIFTNGSETMTLTIRDTQIVSVDMVNGQGTAMTYYGTQAQPLVLKDNPSGSFVIQSGVVKNWNTGETLLYQNGKISALQNSKVINFSNSAGSPEAGIVQTVQLFSPEGNPLGYEVHMDEGFRQQFIQGNQSAIGGFWNQAVDNQPAPTVINTALSWINQVNLKRQDLAGSADQAVDKLVNYLKPQYDQLKQISPLFANDQSLELLRVTAKGFIDTIRIGDRIDSIFNESGDLIANWNNLTIPDRTKKALSIGGNVLTETFRALNIVMVMGAIKSVGEAVTGTAIRAVEELTAKEAAEEIARLIQQNTDESLAQLKNLLKNPEIKETFLKTYKSEADIQRAISLKLLDLTPDVAATFKNGQYTIRVLQEDMVLYRAEGGAAREFGSFFGTQKPLNAVDAEKLYNITQYGNTAERVSTYIVPKGTVVYEGAVEGGTGTQLYIKDAEEKAVRLVDADPLK